MIKKFIKSIGTFSNVLLAVADANYKFIYISYGSYGYQSDAGIFQRFFYNNYLCFAKNFKDRICLPKFETGHCIYLNRNLFQIVQMVVPFLFIFSAIRPFPCCLICKNLIHMTSRKFPKGFSIIGMLK
jgi:hypothetical protein